MKILYVDTSINGHHIPYIKLIMSLPNNDTMFLLPNKIDGIPIECQYINKADIKKYVEYIKWLKYIKDIAEQNNINTIHFLYGDIFYRFMGLGFNKLKKFNIYITFHHVRVGKLYEISLKNIFKKITFGVVHTVYLYNLLSSFNINNVYHIEYPVFEKCRKINNSKIRNDFGILPNVPILLSFGGTRKDKGLDILLDSLLLVKEDYKLIIAGKPEYFTEKFIIDKIKPYSNKVKLYLKFISEREMKELFSISDVVVLPYRKIFDGASGPLSLGCAYNKAIIGPNHGSLGDIIEKQHLGYTFISENQEDLAKKISQALKEKFNYDKVAKNYRMSLNVDNFLSNYNQLYCLGEKL